MKTFKTIHVLELLTGKELIEDFPRFKGLTEVLLFLCGAENLQREITAKHLIAIDNVNRVVYTEALFSEHSSLRDAMENAPFKAEASLKEWRQWAKETIVVLGEELLISRAERTTVVPPPKVVGSLKIHFNFN